jgi:5-methyltetrahydropteroyltriglutamate--homocysteine methyltransferase
VIIIPTTPIVEPPKGDFAQMSSRIDRITTTHVGSLPRSQAVTDVVFARETDAQRDLAADDAVITAAVAEVVNHQKKVGIDFVSDGEMSKISYATYIADRFSGFDGDSPRQPGQDLVEFPALLRKLAERGSTAKYRRPRCVGPVAVKNLRPLESDIANLNAAVTAARPQGAFMNAASPGVIALFQPNDFYPTQDAYLEALADALAVEYEAIVRGGIILQIDAPDLAMGRHTMYRDRTVEEFEKLAARHIEVLNHALRNVPAERVRMHVCWGNYEGPHHHDIPLERLLPVVIKAKPQGLLFEAANPRHAHEWSVFKKFRIPDDKIMIPGLLATTTNYIEHPELVAERIERFAQVVGRERVVAGTDCGFGTFAGFGPVEPDIAYLKLRSLVEGAQIASSRLWH